MLPSLREFKPELVMISAGFDGHWEDTKVVDRFGVLLRKCRALLQTFGEYQVFVGIFRSLLLEYGALLQRYRALGQYQGSRCWT